MKDFEDEREKDREIGELKIADEGLGKGRREMVRKNGKIVNGINY